MFPGLGLYFFHIDRSQQLVTADTGSTVHDLDHDLSTVDYLDHDLSAVYFLGCSGERAKHYAQLFIKKHRPHPTPKPRSAGLLYDNLQTPPTIPHRVVHGPAHGLLKRRLLFFRTD